jgi:hypothetical protein
MNAARPVFRRPLPVARGSKPGWLLVGGALLAATFAAEPNPESVLHEFLRRYIGFSDEEIQDVERGKIVAKVLETDEEREIASFGAARLAVPETFFLDEFRDIERFKKSEEVMQIGKFSDPPCLEDLRELRFEPEDLEAIKSCKPGDCDVKMSSRAMGRFHAEVDWSAADHLEQAADLAREVLLEYVEAYLEGGNDALSVYTDHEKPLRVSRQFGAILGESPYLYDYAPELHRYLLDFPDASLSDAETFLYWSKEKLGFGLKPVVSLTHVVIYRRALRGEDGGFIASKQIYASHYFEASLGLTTVVADTRRESSSYVMYLNRSRADALRGGWSGLKRSFIEGSLQGGMKDSLELIKSRLENAYR